MVKVAIVYDWVNQIGGAERVLTAIRRIWPKAPLFTSVYQPDKAQWAQDFLQVKASFLQRIPGAKKYYYLFAPLIPLAFEQFCFDDYDLVISVTSGPAKAIITKPETCHICYCLTPPRHFWQKRFLRQKWLFPWLMPFRVQDYLLSQRPDYFFAISHYVARRIKKFYHRGAEVIYPGVDLAKFKPSSPKQGNYFLVVSRLVGYKRVDLVIKVFNQLGLPLRIVGSGRKEKELRRIAKDNIEFLGELSDRQLIQEYQSCQAVIFPQEEDFGLVPIEAQACGRPVIAFGRGGALETVIPGKTGEFFFQQEEEELIKLIKNFNPAKYRPEICRRNAQRFELKKFMLSFKNKVIEKFKNYQKKLSLV